MKQLFLFLACLISHISCLTSAFAQAPEKMNYQGVARDLSGNVLPNQNIGLRLTLHSTSAGGPVVYQETQATATNAFGLFDIKIGDGTVVSGTFSTISWGSDVFYIQSEMDAAGGTNYQNMGTSQLVSVPYALYAKTSGNTGATGATGAPGATGSAGATGATGAFPAGTNPGDMQYWNGTSWVMIPIGTPGQFLQVDATNVPTWTGGGLATLTTDPIPSQVYFSAYNGAGGNLSNTGITASGGSPVFGYGMVWSTSPNPTMADDYSYYQSNITVGAFNSYLTNLAPGTTYFVRAYVINSAGVAYGNQVSFSTFNTSLPTVTTTPVTGVTGGVAYSGGNVSADGGANVTAKGVCWSTSPSPTIANSKTVDGFGNGSFSSIANGLVISTTYYLRAYATNIAGTSYGNEYTFTTTSTLSIGSYHQGGIIGYFLQNGDPGYDINVLHGIIISQSNIGTGVVWGCEGTLITGANGTLIGDGAQNTLDIIAGCNTPGIAAELCNSLVLNSYSDWFLPSDNEWIAMDLNLVLINGISNAQGYWTSNQFSANNANINFNNYPSYTGYIGNIPKSDANSYGGVVRAIRMF